MKPLLKWPGGKSRELEQLTGLIPSYDRYIEPFFGGGAMFFALQPKASAINDVSRDLMEFYHLVRTQNPEFRQCLLSYAVSFRGLQEFARTHHTELLDLFRLCQEDPLNAKTQLQALLDDWAPQILALFPHPLVPDQEAFLEELKDALWDKLRRTAKNHIQKPFSPEDLLENLVTGLTSGYYLYFRQVFNAWQQNRLNLTPGQRSANFFFIRENCYGAMFRYNKNGQFNIPYGGISYNRKDFSGKVDNLFQPKTAAVLANAQIYSRDFEYFLNQIHLRPRDFLFLDPPYDTEFSDYEGTNFTKLDQARLAVTLSRVPSRFLLIIKSTPFIEDLYSEGFRIRRFSTQYTYNMRSRNNRASEHLIITNYDPE